MARLLRSTTESRLRPPTALAASIVFRGVVVKHAAVKPRADYAQRHFAKSDLKPPAVISALFTASPVKLTLAPSSKQARASHPHLSPPTALAASIVFRPLELKLAPSPLQGRTAHSKLRPPTVLGVVVIFIAAPIKTTLNAIEAARRPKSGAKLNPPALVGASIVFAPIRKLLAWQFPRPATGTHSRLRPPAVTGAVVVAALAAPIKLTLVAVRTGVELIRHRSKSKLKPPTAVDPSTVFPPVDAKLAPSGRQARAAHSSLKGPTAVSGARVFAPIKAKLALQVPRQGRQTHSKLRLPVFKAPDLIAGAVSIIDTVLALVGIGDSSDADVSVSDETGDDVTIVEPPR